MIMQYLSNEVKPQGLVCLHTKGDLGHSVWLPVRVVLFEGSEDKSRQIIFCF